MTLNEVRSELLSAQEQLRAGNYEAVEESIAHALEGLEPARLLTISEAAGLLGLRNVNTVELWHRNGFLHGVERNRRVLIPVSEVERVLDSERVRALRRSAELHDLIGELGGETDLTDAELALLGRSPPDPQPWDLDPEPER